MLQWGHALSGMDTLESIPYFCIHNTLQWGHALSGMDTFLLGFYAASKEYKLQWGHALSGMDTA